LFVSDLHLDAAWPRAIEQFLGFLDTAAPAAEALYVLGDLFEAWIGDDDPDPHRARVCEGLQRLTERGIPCYVMHGNRDFLLHSGFEARTGCQLLRDPTVIDLYGESVLLTHGDALCTRDRAYQHLRAIVRRPRWQRRFLRLSVATRRALAEAARAGSRAHTGMQPGEIMDVTEGAVAAAMRACGTRLLVHGHTHRPAIHELELDGLSARRIVLGAWYEQGSCLVWERGGYRLEQLGPGGPE
jgi:UDP-2,3-diacylglucosamine hydrolase